MKYVNPLLILLILQTYISVVLAAETGYEVELIIFEDKTGRYLRSEDWSYNDMLNNIDNVPSEELKPDVDPEYIQLDWKGSKLEKKLSRLQNNSNYKVLVNTRWKQTGLDRKHAFNIPVGTQQAVDDSAASPDNVSTLLETPDNQPSTDSYISGTVKLIMSRYLHFNINLQYTKPQFNENNEIEDKVYPVVNERRMRSKEIHYIDHPLVGVIVLATPFKIEQKDTETGTTEYKTM